MAALYLALLTISLLVIPSLARPSASRPTAQVSPSICLSLSLSDSRFPCEAAAVTRTTCRFSRWLTACIAAERRYLIASRLLLLLLPSHSLSPCRPIHFRSPLELKRRSTKLTSPGSNWKRLATAPTELCLYTLYTKMSDVELLSRTTLSRQLIRHENVIII